jgi:hypothetical protein
MSLSCYPKKQGLIFATSFKMKMKQVISEKYPQDVVKLS